MPLSILPGGRSGPRGQSHLRGTLWFRAALPILKVVVVSFVQLDAVGVFAVVFVTFGAVPDRFGDLLSGPNKLVIFLAYDRNVQQHANNNKAFQVSLSFSCLSRLEPSRRSLKMDAHRQCG